MPETVTAPAQPRGVRILLLEDSAADAELCLRELRNAGLEVTADVVRERPAFEQALAAHSYDVILSDCNLPLWTGLDALEVVRSRGLDTPFVLLTSRLGEQAAAECVPKGASDYVLKDGLSRLPIAIRRALAEQARRHEWAEAERALRAAERRCHLLLERCLAGVLCVTLDGRILDCNAAAARILGYDSPAELLAEDVRRLYWSLEDREKLRAGLEQAGSVTDAEVCARRRDGSPVWLLANAALIRDAAGPVIEATLIDITGYKRAQEKILELNRLYSVLSHLGQAVVRVHDRDELLRAVCRIAVEDGQFRMAWFGLVDEASGRVEPVAHGGVEAGYLDAIGISVQAEAQGNGPTGTAVREGRYVVCNDVVSDPAMLPWRDEALKRGYRSSAAFPVQLQGRFIGALSLYAAEPGFFDEKNIGLLQEVVSGVAFALESMDREARRKRAESERAQLSASEQAARSEARAEARFRELLEAAPDAILEVDRDGRILLLNPATERLFGYRRDELLGQTLELLVPERLRAGHAASRAAYFADPVSRTVQPGREIAGRRKDGAEFPIEVGLSPVQTAEGCLVTCIIRDITHRKQAEQALRESNRQIVSILESITDGFFALDGEWRFTYLNSKAEQIISRKRADVLGKKIWEEFPDLVGTVFQHQYRKAAAEQKAAEFTAFDPVAKIWAEVHVYPSAAGLSIYVHDITARKQLEDQFRQSQKLEALGRLAGGVAHDFNNLLTIIGGYGQMALENLEPRSPIHKDLEAIVEAAERASALTRQLLAFSRRQHVQPKILDPNRLVVRMNKMLRRVIGEDIELKLVLNPQLGWVRADPGQLEQVVINLSVNARDAMPRGGTLTITTDNVEIRGAGASPGLRAGNYVMLSVSDSGAGMDAETRSHIFEPFFTTKAKGKGTGLGLATVYGIVKQSGGEIAVDTELGQGTTIRMYLPRARAGSRAKRAAALAPAPRAGTETILLVEDEAEVRTLTREILLRQGYTVLEAADGAEALTAWQEYGSHIDLLLTDIIMPQMSGRELAEKLTTMQPDMRVLYMSGYTHDVIARHGALDSSTELLPKPFTQEALAFRVRKVLDRREPGEPEAAGS